MAEHRDTPGMPNLPQRLSDAQLAQMVSDEFAREPMDYAQAYANLADRRFSRYGTTPFRICVLSTLACALGLYFTVTVNLWAAVACLLVGVGCLLTSGITTWRSV